MIKKLLFSTNSSSTMNAVGILLLRLMFGAGMLIGHGRGKLASYVVLFLTGPGKYSVDKQVR